MARNGYSYAPFIAKSKAPCGLRFDQLGGHVELPWLMRKYDVIHKTDAAREDRTTAIGNMHKNLVKIGRAVTIRYDTIRDAILTCARKST